MTKEISDLIHAAIEFAESETRWMSTAQAAEAKAQLLAAAQALADMRTLDRARADGHDFGQPYPETSKPSSPWRIESNDSDLYWQGPTPDAARHAAAEWVRAQVAKSDESSGSGGVKSPDVASGLVEYCRRCGAHPPDDHDSDCPVLPPASQPSMGSE